MPAAKPIPLAVPSLADRFCIAAWITVGALLGLLLCCEWYGPDIWYHLYLGGRIIETHSIQPAESLLQPPPSFINLYWLFQVVMRKSYDLGGVYGPSALLAACWAGAFWFWAKTSRAFTAGAWGSLLALGSVLICQPRFDLRPEVVSYLLCALQIHWLSSWDFSGRLPRKKICAFLASEIVWVNVHGYFALGPLLVGARWLGSLVHGSRAGARPERRQLAALLGLVLLATLASPLGPRAWEGVISFTRTLRELRTAIQEFYPPIGPHFRLWTVKIFWLYWVLVAFAALAALIRAPRRNFFAIALAVAGLYLGATAFRNLPLLVWFAAPVWADVLPRLPRWRTALVHALTITACLALGTWAIRGGFYESLRSESGFGVGESAYAYPIKATAYLRETNFTGTLFNSSRDGGYLEFHLPGIHCYGDSRLIDPTAVREYFAAVAEPDAFARLDAQFHFDAVLLPVDLGHDVITALLRDPHWRLVHADLHRALLVNLAAPAGGAAPARPPALYAGEDLTLLQNGSPASQWIAILVLAEDRPDLVAALRQFSAAPKIPAFVGEFALRYALATGDHEVAGIVRPIRGKFVAPSPDDQRVLDDLFVETSSL